MADLWMDVDIALAEVPVNILPLLDDTDFKTRETAVVYNAAGMDLVWNFVTTGGAMTQTAVTPTTSGNYDWTHQGDGMYTIEIPASGGSSINNNIEGFGWFTGLATGVLPWRGPIVGFRAAALNNSLVDGVTIDVNVTAVSGDTASADNLESYTDGTTPMPVNATQISGDVAAADNAESFFDGTGYAGTNNVIPTVTTLSNLPAIAANWLTAAGIAAGALNGKGDWNVGKTGYALSLAGILAIWDALTSALTTAGSIGKLLVDNINATIISRASQISLDTIDDFLDTEVAGIKVVTDALPDGGQLLALTTIQGYVVDIDETTQEILADTDDIGVAGAGLVAVPWNGAWNIEVQSEVQDALEVNHLDHLLAVDYDPASKPGVATALLNEIIGNDGGVSQFTVNALELGPGGGGAPTVAAIADAVWDEAVAGHVAAGSFGEEVQLHALTSELPAAAPTAAVVADAVWDEAVAGHVAAGSFGEYVQLLPAPGAGAVEWDNIIVDDAMNPLQGVELWITSEVGGTNVVWYGHTDIFGNPRDVAGNNVWLDVGTYYIWCHSGLYTFTNPATAVAGVGETISGTAVGASGSITVQSLVDEIQVDVDDEGTWSDAEVLQFLNDVIKDYSLHFPRLRMATIVAVADEHKYDLPGDHMNTLFVEFPALQDSPCYLSKKSFMEAGWWGRLGYYDIFSAGDQEDADQIWISGTPVGGETILISYRAYHAHDLTFGDFMTVPSEKHHVLKAGVLWLASRQIMMNEMQDPTSNSSLLMSQLAANSNGLRADYLEMLGVKHVT